jgi:hypothetical protein
MGLENWGNGGLGCWGNGVMGGGLKTKIREPVVLIFFL